MGKKTSRKNSTEEPEEAKIMEDNDKFESDLVQLKKENAKILQKSISKMESDVKQNLDAK
jgi:hypothetical protein